MATKRDLIGSMIDRAVGDACKEIAFNQKEHADCLRAICRIMQINVRFYMTGDDYRWLQIQDIMAWRKRAIKD